MAVFLYHGPPGPQKTHKLFEKLKEIKNLDSALLVVPDSDFVQSYKTLIPSKISLPQKNLCSWEDFLFGLAKPALSQTQKCSDFLESYLIFLLSCQNKSGFAPSFDLVSQVKNIQGLFAHWKRGGFGPKLIREKFSGDTQHIEMINLFQKFQTWLQKLHVYDEGDLTLTTLRLLEQQTLTWPLSIREVFLIDHYPLDTSQREILRLLKKHLPEVTYHIFYDENFDRHEDALNQAYEDLGNLSDEAYYLEGPQGKPPLYEFSNPFEEMLWVAQNLKKQLEKDSSQQWAIATSPTYAFYWDLILENYGISFASTFPQSFRNSFFSHDNDFSQNAFDLVKKNFPELPKKLAAIHCLESHEKEKDALKILFSELRKDFAEKEEEAFFENYRETLEIKQELQDLKVLVCDVPQALAQKKRCIFLTGFFLENFKWPEPNPLLSQMSLCQKEMAGLFVSPSDQLKILLEKATHLFPFENLVVTSSQTDFSGKPTTPFFQHCLQKLKMIPPEVVFSAQKNPSSFPPIQKKEFSVTELQTYLQCPYKYYGAYFLKLGEKEKEEFDPKPSQRGSFVHSFLQKFLKKHNKLYQDFLKTEGVQKDFLNTLREDLSEEIKNFKFENIHTEISKNFFKRLQKTLEDFFLKEKNLFRKDQKTTLPTHFEWKIENFFLPTKVGLIQITGRVDRIDRDEKKKQVTIIDYKTGTAESFSQIQKTLTLQLPLYAMAVQKILYPNDKMSAILYYEFKTNHISGLTLTNSTDQNILTKHYQISETAWQDIIENVSKKVEVLLNGITQGDFHPNPQDPSKCQFCDYRRICGYKKGQAA